MSTSREWRPVTRSNPCPACGKPDWCAWSRAGFLKCERAVEPPRGMRMVRTIGAGALFQEVDGNPNRSAGFRGRIVRIESRANPEGQDFGLLAARFVDRLSASDLQTLAGGLGLTAKSLRRLGVGRAGRASSWPMRDPAGQVTGIRLRYPDSSKLSVRGSRDGLFLPSVLAGSGPLLIAEGATDTAALLDLGFDAIGRSSCGTGAKLAIEFLRAKRPGATVVVADGDVPGQRGAAALASALALHCPDVRVITPPEPFKDAREWAQAGARRGDVLTAIEAATSIRATVAVRGAVQ